MDNLSTPNRTDISSLIGALELSDHLTGHDDSVLEASMGDSSAPTFYCYVTKVQCAGDNVLETAGVNAVAIPTAICNSTIVCR